MPDGPARPSGSWISSVWRAISTPGGPFLFCGSLLHKHKHFPRVDVAWLPCPPAASFIGSITLVRCLPLASCSLVNERYCVILSMEHCEGSCCCETSLLLQVRFEISRYGLLRFNIILSFVRFEAAVDIACRIFYSSAAKHHDSLSLPDHAAVCAAPYIAIATGLRVCINTVPGPTNLHTRPSLAAKLLIMPPDAIRSSVYLQFHATRWPLSMMYFSPSRS